MASFDARLLDTRGAFDSVAATYDGPQGNNALIQQLRERLLAAVIGLIPADGRLLDLGCGTGLDSAHLARRGYTIVATDWSPAMVARTRERAAAQGLADRITAVTLGIHELDELNAAPFDAIYSDLGPFNCVPDLDAAAQSCARLLRPGGALVISAIGRVCPWEIASFTLRGQLRRATVRFSHRAIPVGLNQRTVWTRYYTPRAFARHFAPAFALTTYRALALAAPPPYFDAFAARHPRLTASLWRLDDRLGALPVLRDLGDHFLLVLTRRE
ncbi:MAG: class I SAM-dependent methyltransferase [Thermomicrobiales bacterium]